ncbi:MAG: hypothetical protein JOZ15_19460 [Acidobacteria bacterium]|nr:hypothetical protein [Acidobacteriota bacterium]
MAEETEYTGGGYASSGWHETFPPQPSSGTAAAFSASGGSGSSGAAHDLRSDSSEDDDGDGAPAGSLRDQLQDLRQQAREETASLAADARAQVAALVHRRQERVADRLAGVAAALRDAGRRLEREAARSAPPGGARGAGTRPPVAGVDDRAVGSGLTAGAGGYPPFAAPPPPVDAATRGLCELAERAAQQVERASRYLRRSELRDVVRDVEDLARRRPVAFVGGSLATGLLLARFLKSSGERRLPEKLAGRQ